MQVAVGLPAHRLPNSKVCTLLKAFSLARRTVRWTVGVETVISSSQNKQLHFIPLNTDLVIIYMIARASGELHCALLTGGCPEGDITDFSSRGHSPRVT